MKINMKQHGSGRAFKRPMWMNPEREKKKKKKQQKTGTNKPQHKHNYDTNPKHENITSTDEPRMENRCGFDLQCMVNVLHNI